MKPFGWQLVAASSLSLALAHAEMRPQYGGTAHMLLGSAPNSLDPVSPQADPFTAGKLLHLIYDTLVSIDDSDNIQPELAVSWEVDKDRKHWRFRLRPGVKFEDGSPLTADLVATSLRQVNTWSVFPQGDSIEIDLQQADDLLPAELSLTKNAIVKRNESAPSGTGPFRVGKWESGKRLVLTANEEYWGGRPFLNSVEIEFGNSYRDQETALELGRADLVEIATEQARRLETGARHVSESGPLELLALVFAHEAQSANESKLRQALTLCIDRISIRDVLLGGQGDLAAGILPNWITGYEFLFATEMDVRKAQEERGEVSQAPVWMLGYNSRDPISKVVAERIVLNARDVGLRVQLASGANADVQLVRIRLESMNPGIALKTAAVRLGLPEPKLEGVSMQQVYEAEAALLQGQKIIPLFHVPVVYGVGGAVKGWKARLDGSWPLTDVWLGH
jgi:peptide/nickel transport system substrate-binding protein